MDETIAKDTILAHACCSFGMCNYCPFCKTDKCKDISFTKDNLTKAIKMVKGVLA